MKDLTLSLIQSDITWEERDRNLQSFEKWMDSINESPDIILLPEMFNTGFSINPDACAETMSGETMNFLKSQSGKRNCMIIGSLMISENGDYFNRIICMRPDGQFDYSDKRHLFRLSEEYKMIRPGGKKIIVNWNGWKILPLICYDLRFPVWSRNYLTGGKDYNYDLLLYIANWPQSRAHIWRSLLVARAIENLVFAAGVNRIGTDGFGTAHCGGSMVIDPKGFIMAEAGKNKETVLTVKLFASDLLRVREKYPFGMDWDLFCIIL